MKKIFSLVFALFIYLSTFSTHIVGGDIAVRYLSPNTFRITLTFFRDCSAGTAAFDNPILLGMFDKVTNVKADSFSLPMISNKILQLGDSCFTPSNLCVEEGIFEATVTIPNNPNGYYITWQRCCRNSIIQNIVGPGNTGLTFYVEIPDPALNNSTPTFGSYPNAYFCANTLNNRSFTCTDVDGDQLVYSLITPLHGNFPGGIAIPPTSPAPYPDVTWQAPYSATDMVGGIPAMSISSTTGILSATPPTLGVFVFAVKVEEYRAGVKIGEIRRDVQYQVLTCPSNQKPYFTAPTPSSSAYTIIAGDSLCIPVAAADTNLTDWITLTATSPELFIGSPNYPTATFQEDSAQGNVSSTLCLYTRCDHIRTAPYHITLYVKDSTCLSQNTVLNDVDITVIEPISGSLDSVPNVFTPNGDNINEYFFVGSKNVNLCFDEFNIEIYNRWGIKVFESNDFFFQWDGRITSGQKASDGVYFYILEAKFKDVPYVKKGAVHLYR